MNQELDRQIEAFSKTDWMQAEEGQIWSLTTTDTYSDSKLIVGEWRVRKSPRRGVYFEPLFDFPVSYIGVEAKIIISGELVNAEFDSCHCLDC